MKYSAIPLLALSTVMLACDSKKEGNPGSSGGTTAPGSSPIQAAAQAAPNGKLVTHKLLDDKYMEMGTLPLPDNWILNNGKAAMSGPGNANVYMLPLKNWMNGNGQYVPSNNPHYDPNRDPSLQDQQWNETEIED
ncbi:hypothetical protein POL68_35350 [Stigmatella sp. ncwal1]|uniref:Lipoprotein n=1 Tax=Stigmatella ashevillensis TaxID=2995309 RepID=A0ABT5DJH0_9BACT|nr:hypothetical protein [Stigmatella ashevillena]MDC0713797.1 hypothetical protein [Stigmatella ashevillena]